MSERLDKVKLVKGTKWERQDPPDNIGVPTLELVKDAIREDKKELARDLAEYYYWWEIKWVRDANIDLVNGLSSYYMANYGEDSIYAAYRELNQRNRVAVRITRTIIYRSTRLAGSIGINSNVLANCKRSVVGYDRTKANRGSDDRIRRTAG